MPTLSDLILDAIVKAEAYGREVGASEALYGKNDSRFSSLRRDRKIALDSALKAINDTLNES